MEKTDNSNQNNKYNPLKDPNALIFFLIKERELMKVKGEQNSQAYIDLVKIIDDTMKQYK